MSEFDCKFSVLYYFGGLVMKKRYLAAGLISSVFAGAVVYNKLKNNKDDNVLMYPVCRVTMHSSECVFGMDELIKASEVIVSGYVENVSEARWNNLENKQPQNISSEDVIYKDYEIKIEKVIKGIDAALNHIKLRSFEGVVNGFTVEDNSQAILNAGDRLVVFLKKDKSIFNKRKQMDYYVPVYQKQGVFLYDSDKVTNTYLSFDIDEFNSQMQIF